MTWLVIGWLLGVGTGLLGIAVTGGWYEYELPSAGQAGLNSAFARGCQPVEVKGILFVRCPRFRLQL